MFSCEGCGVVLGLSATVHAARNRSVPVKLGGSKPNCGAVPVGDDCDGFEVSAET